MKTKLVRVGNSRGIRLPKPMIEEADLGEEVELHVRRGSIVIVRVQGARAGWAEAAKKLHAHGGDRPFDPPTPTRFDKEEWQW